MTWEPQSTIETSGIECPALRIHIPCMAHVIQLGLGAFMSSPGVNGPTQSSEAYERDQQFGKNESTDNGKSQWLRTQGNARINKVLAMRPHLAKIIDKVLISRYVDSPEMLLNIAANAPCIDYTDSWPSKRVHWLSKSQSTNCSTANYGCGDTLEFETGVAWANQPIMWIHPWVAQESTIQWSLATLDNTGWMDHRQVCPESFKAVLILDPVDVETASDYPASC